MKEKNWQIHFDIWQNQYNVVKLNKIKLKKKEIFFQPSTDFNVWEFCYKKKKRNLSHTNLFGKSESYTSMLVNKTF